MAKTKKKEKFEIGNKEFYSIISIIFSLIEIIALLIELNKARNTYGYGNLGSFLEMMNVMIIFSSVALVFACAGRNKKNKYSRRLNRISFLLVFLAIFGPIIFVYLFAAR